jgi:hypothetical protein
MKYLCALCAGVFAFALAADASAQTLKATMHGGEETPILNTGAVGTADVIVDETNQEITVTLRVFNIPTPTTAGHIHIGAAGIAGPVVVNFPDAIVGRTGDFAMTFRVGPNQFVARPAIGINTMQDAIQAIVNGNSYVNIHTQQFPAGEIRGQLAVVK